MIDSTDAVIAAMLREDFYPHPITAPLRLVQTHISYVVLTGEFAYKVKKPVRFNFLDFSTLEKRRHYCHEELRLNRVCAPEIYLSVEPVSENNGRFILDSANPVEYAVKMRQFDEANLLTNVFQRGELTAEQVLEMARMLAEFHDAASTNADIAQYGRPEWIRKAIDDNRAVEKNFLNLTQTPHRYEAVHRFLDRFIERHEDLFLERVTSGKIRECHGDLHLNNICIYDGHIRFFDRIEFSESLKNIDVIYDAAFLAMDLTFRGREDLATLFLNEYLERTGDYRGARLLPLYLAERAIVRGKVSSLQSADPHVEAAEQRRLRELAAAYFALAHRYTQPPPPRIFAMSGLSGAGKSTVARLLAAEDGAIILRSDALRKHLAGIPLSGTSDALYSEPSTAQTYETLIELGVELAGEGLTVILDATFPRNEQRRALAQRARQAGIPLRFVWCNIDSTTARARLASRGQDVSDADDSVLAEQEKSFQPFAARDDLPVTVLETDDRQAVERAVQDLATSSPN